MTNTSTILLIDSGNSRVKWWCLTPNSLYKGEFLHLTIAPTADTLPPSERALATQPIDAYLNTCFAELHDLKPEQVLVSHVAGLGFKNAVDNYCERHWRLKPRWLLASAQFLRLINGYQKPEQLGVDRWFNMIAAADRCADAFTVVSLGTAITIDLVDDTHHHLGGWILPGLSSKTPANDPNWQRHYPSMIANIVTGMPVPDSATSRNPLRVNRSSNSQIINQTIFITGGDSATLLPLLAAEANSQLQIRLLPEGVLEGMAVWSKTQR